MSKNFSASNKEVFKVLILDCTQRFERTSLKRLVNSDSHGCKSIENEIGECTEHHCPIIHINGDEYLNFISGQGKDHERKN